MGGAGNNIMKPVMRRFLKYVGYLRPRTRWGWVIRGVIAMVVLMPVTVELTSQSWFCNSCHIMNPYYASWHTGPHKEVECVRCHIPPGMGNFVTAKLNGAGQVVDDVLDRTSGKPSAHVPDSSCLRSGCHNIDYIRAKKVNNGHFLFDHGKHVGREYKGIEIHCTTCHAHVKGNNHFEVNTNACVTCHLLYPQKAAKPVQMASDAPASGAKVQPAVLVQAPAAAAGKAPSSQCRTCHDPPAREIMHNGLKVVHTDFISFGAACESCHSGVTEKPAPIRDEKCFSCHEFGMERMTNVQDMHRVHSSGKHKVECFSCHGWTLHGPAAQALRLERLDCQGCHHGQHAIQQNAYKVDPARLVSAHEPVNAQAVSPMFLAHVACSGCHIKPRALKSNPLSGATVNVAVPEACDSCHKPGAGDQIAVWQKATKSMYEGIEKMLPAGDRPLDARQQQLVNEARGLLDLVRTDGSWGVHNPKYTQRLLEQAQQKLAALGPQASAREDNAP